MTQSPGRESRPPLCCDRCSKTLIPGRGEFYLVRIEAFADPTPPTITEEDLAGDLRGEIERLLQRMHELSARELSEGVHRRRTLCLCNGCYRRWIEDPVGR